LRAFIQTLSVCVSSFFWFRPRAQEDEEKLGEKMLFPNKIRNARQQPHANCFFFSSSPLPQMYVRVCVCVCERQLVQDIPGEVTYTQHNWSLLVPLVSTPQQQAAGSKEQGGAITPFYSFVCVCVLMKATWVWEQIELCDAAYSGMSFSYIFIA
jgi:hypothetical protein